MDDRPRRKKRQPPAQAKPGPAPKHKRPDLPPGQRNFLLPGLRAARLERGWTQRELGDRAEGMMQQVVSGLEWGDHAARPETVARLARALRVKPKDLMTGGRYDD